MTSFLARVRWAQLFVFAGLVALVEEGLSSVSRGTHGKSDLSVFYRTAVLLWQGADASIYSGRDAVSGWYRCIPPAGLMWFWPLAQLSPRAASFGWMGCNFAFAGAGVWALRGIFQTLWPGQNRTSALVWWAGGLFLFLAAPSVEVGQYSLMFCSLWLLAARAALARRLDLAAVVLALPAAIKMYPALLLLAFLGALPLRKWPRFALMFAIGFAFWTWGAPRVAFGARVPSLSAAFFREIVFSPTGRLSESQSTSANSSHGLDTVMLRFLSQAPEPRIAPPHLELPVPVVLAATNVVRLLIIGATLALWWRRARSGSGERDWMDSLALWSAALFLILPGAKARYAVYAFPAFLPLLGCAVALFQRNARGKWSYTLFLALTMMLVMSLVPDIARVWGAGFWGALALWLENARLLRRSPLTHREEDAVEPLTLPLPAKT
jgi:hypothetical protein